MNWQAMSDAQVEAEKMEAVKDWQKGRNAGVRMMGQVRMKKAQAEQKRREDEKNKNEEN